MGNQEMLQAIGKMMDEKMAVQKTEIIHKTQLLIENHFDPKFNLLAENQQIIMEKLKKLKKVR